VRTGLTIVAVLSAVVTVAVSGLSSSASAAVRKSAGPTWSGTRVVTYCTEGTQALTMSLFAPTGNGHPAPVVLQVHGGGWQHGQRWVSLSQSTTATDLVHAGFVVASIDYRLAPAHPWPDQIIDTKCAVRYLRANAATLGLNPNKIAAMGTSAGGQLVSLLGTTGTAATTATPATPGSDEVWDMGPYKDVSSKVDAVVDEFGPADLTALSWPKKSIDMIHNVFGVVPGSDDQTLSAASPAILAAAGDPPFLILQGTSDQVVPETQSKEFAQRLRSAGVPVRLVLVDHGQHGLDTPSESPSPDAISTLITRYLQQTIGS
jgi:acetyl esterase/lipase